MTEQEAESVNENLEKKRAGVVSGARNNEEFNKKYSTLRLKPIRDYVKYRILMSSMI